jgi:hypothetical protein
MALIADFLVQGIQMLLVLLLAPLVTGFIRVLKAQLLRRRGPALLQPYRDLLQAVAQGGGSGGLRVLAVSGRALSDFRRDLGGGFAGADFRQRPAVQLDRRFDRDCGAARHRPLFPGAGGSGCRDQLRRHRLQPRDDDRVAGRTGHADDGVHPVAAGGHHELSGGRPVHADRRCRICGCRWDWR